MTKLNVEKEILDIIAIVLKRDSKEIAVGQSFKNDLEVDSIDIVEILSLIEGKYNIALNDDSVEDVQTVGQVVDLAWTAIES